MKRTDAWGWGMFYLGAALGVFAHTNLFMWEFYAIIIPTIFLLTLGRKNENKI